MLKVWNRCQYAFDMHKPEFWDAWQTDDMVIGEKTWENTGKFWICTESRKCRARLECVVLKKNHVMNQNEGLNLSHLETTSCMIRQASSFYGQSFQKMPLAWFAPKNSSAIKTPHDMPWCTRMTLNALKDCKKHLVEVFGKYRRCLPVSPSHALSPSLTFRMLLFDTVNTLRLGVRNIVALRGDPPRGQELS